MANYNNQPEITADMKQRFLNNAEFEYRYRTPKELQKEFDKLTKRKGVFSWIREKLSTFGNMVKIAALSIILGRNQVAKRLDSNHDVQMQKLTEEAQKTAKIQVLEQRLKDLQPKSLIKENEQIDAEDKVTDDEIGESSDSVDLEAPLLAEVEEHGDQNSQEVSKSKTLLGQQVHELTQKYKEGLSKFLEMQTGINRNFIHIQNIPDPEREIEDNPLNNTSGPYIRISLSPDCLAADSQYMDGMTINRYGNVLEQTPSARLLAKCLLHYTQMHRETKNNSLIPGTLPSKQMTTQIIDHFLDRAKDDIAMGTLDTHVAATLFGHQIDCYKLDDRVKIMIDHKELNFSDQKSSYKSFHSALCAVIADKTIGDYAKLNDYAKELHTITKKEVHEMYYPKYTFQELVENFDKKLSEFATDNGNKLRFFSFHGHDIVIYLEPHDDGKLSVISSICLDNEVIYESRLGELSNHDIAARLSEHISHQLELENMYSLCDEEHYLEDTFQASIDELAMSGSSDYQPEVSGEYRGINVEELGEMDYDL